MAGEERWSAVEDVGRLRDALGVPVPPGIPDVFTESVDDPLGDLVARYARTHGPFTVADLATHLSLGAAVVRHTLQRLGAQGRVLDGEFRPAGSETEWCDAEVLRRLRRRSLARLRKEVEPVDPRALARFLPAWQSVADGQSSAGSSGRRGLRGVDGVLTAIDQLAGAPVPASALEQLVLAARVRDYEPAYLDELTTSGEVIWAGQGDLPGNDGWVALHLADQAPLTLPPPTPPFEHSRAPPGGARRARTGRGVVLPSALRPGEGDRRPGARRRAVGPRLGRPHQQRHPHAPARPDPGRQDRPPHPSGTGPHAHHRVRPGSDADPRRVRPRRPAAGRSCRLSTTTRPVAPTRSPSGCSTATAWSPGVLWSANACREVSRPSTRCSRRFEETGRCRRGYFVGSLGAAQFGTSGSIDRLRTFAEVPDDAKPLAVALAATDPANPYGAALPWPDRPERPTPRAGELAGTGPVARPARWWCWSTAR